MIDLSERKRDEEIGDIIEFSKSFCNRKLIEKSIK